LRSFKHAIRLGYKIISFCAGDDKFHMAYIRHTGWFIVN
jgi:hypothetical protein